MKNISDIDTNFKVGNDVNRSDLTFYDCQETPFKIYGLFYEDGKFRRMPEAVAKSVSNGVHFLHANTAGGRVRFKTDSKTIAISALMGELGKMSHFPYTGSIGFDMYADGIYVKTFTPPHNITDSYESVFDFETKALRSITINFPLYSEVKNLYIGLENNCTCVSPEPYVNDKPIVYYGSSITQGGCASRPGSSYQSIIERRFNCDYINLGFSGSARAEDTMIDYIKNLDMSVFVYDYDHNALTAELLDATHEKMFKEVRATHPDIPIIIMSRPKHYLTDIEEKRRQIIENTYKNAVSAGDSNVYFIDGKMLTELCGNEGTVDGCHPTDFGFASMAKAVGDCMAENIFTN